MLMRDDGGGLSPIGRALSWAVAGMVTLLAGLAMLASLAGPTPTPPEPVIWRALDLAPPPPRPPARSSVPQEAAPDAKAATAAAAPTVRPIPGQVAGDVATAGRPAASGMALSIEPAPAPSSSPLAATVARTIACRRLDPRDRPPDCPSEPVERLDKIWRPDERAAPQTRGETLTRAENRVLRDAGWRERCETNDGHKAATCIAFGRAPPPPRTPQELCERAGLGPCPTPPSKAAVESALRQVGAQP